MKIHRIGLIWRYQYHVILYEKHIVDKRALQEDMKVGKYLIWNF